MKLKSLIWMLLVLGLAAAGFWWSRPHPAGVMEQATTSTAKAARKLIGSPDKNSTAGNGGNLAAYEKTPVRQYTARPDEASPGVRTLTDLKADHNQRISAIQNLPKQMSKADLENVYAFLQSKNSQDEDMMGQALKNELMDELAELNPDGLGNLFEGMFRDESQAQVLRDYALQHLIELLQRDLERGGQVSASQLEQVKQVLWDGVKETDSSIAGTSLLGLSRLAEIRPEFEPDRVLVKARSYAENEQIGELTRVTALQLAARDNTPGTLALLLNTARSGQTFALRASAIGALGGFGGPAVKEFLTGIINGDDEMAKPAAKQALHSIKLAEKRGVSMR